MTTDADNFIVVPFNELPSELQEYDSEEERKQAIEAEKQVIRDNILGQSNAEVADNQEHMKLLRALGSDLNINAFAINFRYPDGTLNDDIEECNYLTTRVIEVLSIDKPTDDPTELPLVLTSTAFEHELYGECAMHFQERLGLERSYLDLMVLRVRELSPCPINPIFALDVLVITYPKLYHPLPYNVIISASYVLDFDPHSPCLCFSKLYSLTANLRVVNSRCAAYG